MERKTHSVLWDIALMGVITSALCVVVPLVGLAPLLSCALDARSGRWSATAVMGVCALSAGWMFGGPIGLAIGILCVLFGAGVLVMLRFGISHGDGLLYSILGGEVLVLAFAFILTKTIGSFADVLLDSVVELMEMTPEAYKEPLAVLAVIFREGISADLAEFYVHVDAYSQWEFAELVDAALPMMRQYLSLLLPTVIFTFGLVGAGGSWMTAGYSLKHRAELHPDESTNTGSLPPDFIRWTLPRYCTGLLVLGYALAMLVPSSAPAVLMIAVWIVQTTARIVLSLQGAALLCFFLHRRKVRVYGRWIWTAVFAIAFPTVLFLAGVFDAMFRVRQIVTQQEEMVREVIRRRQEEEAKNGRRPYSGDQVSPSPYQTQEEAQQSPQDGQEENPPSDEDEEKNQDEEES